jgi:chromatin structure-remodeling complex protein RSC7
MRNATHDGVYDTHTNMMFYPKIMQPTHARWEQVPPPDRSSDMKALTNGLTNGHHTNGTSENPADPDTMDTSEATGHSTIFTPIPSLISRNFVAVDTHFTSPPISNAGYPGPDGAITDPTSGPNGLTSIPDDVIDELPEECRKAFEEARRTEVEWKKYWGTEAQSALRADLKVGFSGYPV